MRNTGLIVLVALVFAGGAQGQQPPAQHPVGKQTQAEEPLDIYQIDLNPTGTGFALTKPVLEGNVYVFKVWPDRATIRLPVSRVKKMVRRMKEIEDEIIYRIDLVPTGQMIARDHPTKQGTTYVFHAWRGGTFMSVRQTDVQKITRVAGLEAFKVHLQQIGAKPTGNLPMEGGDPATTIPVAPSSGAQGSAAQGQAPGNWIYQGVPGVTDAWAPPMAVVDSPGGVPRAQPHS